MPNIVIHQLPPYGQGMPLCSTNHQCLKMMDLYIDATLLMEYTTKMHLADFCLAPTKYHPGKTFIKLLTHKTKMSVPNRKHSSLNTKNKEYFDIIKKCTNWPYTKCMHIPKNWFKFFCPTPMSNNLEIQAHKLLVEVQRRWKVKNASFLCQGLSQQKVLPMAQLAAFELPLHTEQLHSQQRMVALLALVVAWGWAPTK